MGEIKVPTRAPWLDPVKKSKQLEVYFDASLGRSGWAQVFKDALAEFNKLSVSHKLGVKLVQGKVRKSAQVEAHASKGNVEFEYQPDIQKRTIPFDGKGVHGLCKPLLTLLDDRAKVDRWRILRAFIYVPAAPAAERNGRPSIVGDGVKLVIAVHELIHACGLVDDREHTVDDVFCWPRLRIGDKPSDDKLVTKGAKYQFKGLPGEGMRTGYRHAEMPPIFLKKPTADKLRKLWA